MKAHFKEIFLIVIAVIGLLFAFATYFNGLKGADGGMFSAIGENIGPVKQENYTSDISTELETVLETEAPVIHYVGGARTVGDAVAIVDMFEVEYEDGTRIPLSSDENTSIYLVSVRDSADNILVEKLTTEDIDAMEEIPSAFVYDKEKHILYFHQSGIFQVFIRVYTGSNQGVLYEFTIPVEVG